MKNLLAGPNSESEDGSIEIIQSEEQRKTRLKNKKDTDIENKHMDTKGGKRGGGVGGDELGDWD